MSRSRQQGMALLAVLLLVAVMTVLIVAMLDDVRFGQHEVTGLVYTLDRSFLSSTLITRPSCCDPRYERYNRNTAAQGGPGNNGTFDNFALAFDGDRFEELRVEAALVVRVEEAHHHGGAGHGGQLPGTSGKKGLAAQEGQG